MTVAYGESTALELPEPNQRNLFEIRERPGNGDVSLLTTLHG